MAESNSNRSSSQPDSPPEATVRVIKTTWEEVSVIGSFEKGRPLEELKKHRGWENYIRERQKDFEWTRDNLLRDGWTLLTCTRWINGYHCAPPYLPYTTDLVDHMRDLVKAQSWDQRVVGRWLRRYRCLPPPPGLRQEQFRPLFPVGAKILVRSMILDYPDLLTEVLLIRLKFLPIGWRGRFRPVHTKFGSYEFLERSWAPDGEVPDRHIDDDAPKDTGSECGGHVKIPALRTDWGTSTGITYFLRNHSDSETSAVITYFPRDERGSSNRVYERNWKRLGVWFSHHVIHHFTAASSCSSTLSTR